MIVHVMGKIFELKSKYFKQISIKKLFCFLEYFREGWEKLGLYEYYKVKNAAKKIKEEEIEQGIRDKSRSPSPIILEPVKLKRVNKRRYRSITRSKSRSKSRSRSRTPPRRGNTIASSKSRSRSPPPPPPRRGNNSNNSPPRRGNNNRRHQRNQSPKRSPALRRSQTPPTSFVYVFC